MAGIDFDPMRLYEPVKFPVSPKTPIISNIHRWDHSQTYPLPDDARALLRGEGSGVSSGFIIDMASSSKFGFLQDHNVGGRLLFPATGYLFLVWQAFAKAQQKEYSETPVVFEDVQFHTSIVLRETGVLFRKIMAVSHVYATGHDSPNTNLTKANRIITTMTM